MTTRVYDPSAAGYFRPSEDVDFGPDDDQQLAWVDILAPTKDEISRLAKSFDFHPIDLVNLASGGERPKAVVHDDYLFMAFDTLGPAQPETTAPAGPDIRQIAVFARQSHLITIHAVEIPVIETVARRWTQHGHGHPDSDAAMLIYMLADAIVDGYAPAVRDVLDQVETIDQRVFGKAGDAELDAIFQLKKRVAELRHIIAPTGDVFSVFGRPDLPVVKQTSFSYFTDIANRISRIIANIESADDIIDSALDVNLSLVSYNMNKAIQVLTIWSIILAFSPSSPASTG
jgi:magnesium transporter